MMEAIEFARKRSKLIGNKNDGERIDGSFLFRFLGRAAHFSRSPSDCQLFLMGSKKIDIRLRVRCNEGGIVVEIFFLSEYNIRYQFNLSYSGMDSEFLEVFNNRIY